MHAHHVVDALIGASEDYHLAVPAVDRAVRSAFLDWMVNRAAAISAAQKFDFENVPVTPCPDDTFDLPGIDKDERQFFSDGLIPIPFPVCWFETQAPTRLGNERLCYLIEEEDDKSAHTITPFRIFRLAQGKAIQFTGEHWTVYRKGSTGEPAVEVYDPFGGAALFDEGVALVRGAAMAQGQSASGEVNLVTFLLLMLVSKSSETVEVEAPAKLNKARARKGKAPVPAHRVVSIVPNRVAKAIREEEGGQVGEGTGLVRSSPRIHWRRSHLRTTASGKQVIVARALVGYKAADGRELVTHDYRVAL